MAFWKKSKNSEPDDSSPSQATIWLRLWGWSSEAELVEEPIDAGAVPSARLKTPYWSLGVGDARYHQRLETAADAIQARTTLEWMDRAEAGRQQQDRELEEIRALEEEKKDLVERKKEFIVRRWQVAGEHLLPPRERLSLFAWLYLTAGAAAFVAEFTIATLMVVEGLEFESAVLTSWSDYTAIALVVAFSVLGLSGKLIWDTFPKHRSDPPPGVEPKIEWARYAAVVPQVILVGLCTWTLLSAASLRGMAERYNDIEEREQRSESGLIGTSAPAQDLNQIDSPATEQDARLEGLGERLAEALEETLQLLAVTLPLFGAIALISGVSQIQTAALDRRAYEQLGALQKRIDEKDDKIKTKRQDLAALRAALDTGHSSGEILSAVVEARLKSYEHGFERGSHLHDTLPPGASLYDRSLYDLRRGGFAPPNERRRNGSPLR